MTPSIVREGQTDKFTLEATCHSNDAILDMQFFGSLYDNSEENLHWALELEQDEVVLNKLYLHSHRLTMDSMDAFISSLKNQGIQLSLFPYKMLTLTDAFLTWK